MLTQTRFISRLLGLSCIIIAIAMLMHKETAVETITALVHDRPLLFIVGVITVFAGLAMVLVHNVWSGAPATVVVTLLSWLTLLKGLLLLCLSPGAAADFYLGTLRYSQLFYLYATFSLTLGVYLAYAGFKAASR